MDYFRYILLIITLLSGRSAQAQGFYQTYSPTSSTAQDVVQTDDGGYFLAGYVENDSTLFLQKVDAAGQPVWANHFNFNRARAIACSKAADGGFGVLTEFYTDTNGYKNAVLKLNAAGTVEWARVIGNHLLPNGLRDMAATPDGGFIAAGDTRDSSLAFQNWLVKIAADGSIAWQKTYGTFQNTSQIVALSTGNFAISGGRNGGDLSLAVVTAAGDLLWQQVYAKPKYQKAYGLLETEDGGLAVLGTNQNATEPRLDICVLKTGENGTEQWFKSIYPYPWPVQSQVLFNLSNFAQDLAGNFYIPVSDENNVLEILKLDNQGNALGKNETIVQNRAMAIIPTNDNFFAIAGGSAAYLLKVDSDGEVYSNRVIGTVFRDTNMDCTLEAGEPGLANYTVQASDSAGNLYFKKTNADGSFELRLPEGNYDLVAKASYGPPALYAICDTLNISIVGTNQVLAGQTIGVEVLGECPMLDVEIGGGLLRRCINTRYTLSWCNYGNLTAENAYIEVVADTLLEYSFSSLPLSAQNGNVYTFNIPDVPVGECGSMFINFLVKCSAAQFDVICVEAHAYPDSSCIPPGANWDGSRIEVTGQCENDTLEFNIKNTGAFPMTETLDYVIIEDDIMYTQGQIQLAAGIDTTIVVQNPTGACYLGKVYGENNGASIINRPTAVVENCITGGNLELALQFETGENNFAVSTNCGTVIGSFDPNDKRGFPLGWGDQHLLDPNQDIEYMIRFQNTGNDTAFLVVIRDTLPVDVLDPGSLRPIASSHNYTWDISGNGVATFTFPNILLPDSIVNEPASHGFVRFRIRQQPDLPDGTLIRNSAAIYFDFNEPVITNEYFHTVGRPIVLVTKTPGFQPVDLQVFPNPFSREATFMLRDYPPNNKIQFKLFDALGQLAQAEQFSGNTFHFTNNHLEPGIYFFQMTENGMLLASGKVAISK